MSFKIGGSIYKVLQLGDAFVGKTCVTLRYTENNFSVNYLVTISIDVQHKEVDVEGEKIKVQIWDTAGQEKYQTQASSYYKCAKGVILCYSITERTSFERIEKWLKLIKENTPDDIQMLLLANKSDLIDKRVVSYEEGETLAKTQNIPFYETSALNGINVDEAFDTLIKNILKNDKMKAENEMPAGVKNNNSNNPKQDGVKLDSNSQKNKKDKKSCNC